MAQVMPFCGMRYSQKAGNIEQLCCPPYDIISEMQRREYVEKNPGNIVRLELPRDGENPYETAHELLHSWIDDEILVHDMEPGLYVYELSFLEKRDSGEPKSLRGVICRVRLEDFENNVVLPHEETLSKAKEDRLNLTKATNCNFSQIYSLFRDEKKITGKKLENITRVFDPRYEFSDGLVTHRLWVVNDEVTIASICDDFTPRKLYIADGHHRYETALSYRNYCRKSDIYNPGSESVMMMLADMSDEGLVVFPTHRLIKSIESFNPEELIRGAGEFFDIISGVPVESATEKLESLVAEGKAAFGFYYGSDTKIFVLRDRDCMRREVPDKSDAYRFLDVTILHTLVLEKLLGIDEENMANQVNLTYTRSFDEAVESVDRGLSQCAFFLNATKVSQIGDVAAAGEKMPQKSTYFYPKLITGLVMNDLGV